MTPKIGRELVPGSRSAGVTGSVARTLARCPTLKRRSIQMPGTPTYFFAIIPAYANLTAEERAVVDAGGPYPVRKQEYAPAHEAFLDYLIAEAIQWAASE